MLNSKMSKGQIEDALSGQGDFVQMDWLTRLLNSSPPIDIRRFIFLKLAQIYEKKFMWSKSAESYHNLALISVTFTDKIKFYTKEAEIWIKKGEFDKADKAVVRALGEANSAEKKEVYQEIKSFYKNIAEKYEQELMRNKALKAYERLSRMELSLNEKKSVDDKIEELYEKLGKRSELSKSNPKS